MKEICLDEGTIQAFLDGELVDAQLNAATRHLALCDECTQLLSAAEEESAFAFSALDGDLNTLVPTQRLWAKINDSITEEKRQTSVWHSIAAFLSNLSRPSIAAFASLLIVAGLFAGLMLSRPDFNKDTAKNNPQTVSPAIKNSSPASASTTNQPEENEPPVDPADSGKEDIDVPTLTTAKPERSKSEEFSATRANLRKPILRTESNPVIKNPNPNIASAPQFLPGEETYIRTIANLSDTVNSQKDTIMKPSARFAYEKDLAVINDAIDKMKAEVKKNPKNDAAKEILFASYQNKINLLNSVAERTELIASIR